MGAKKDCGGMASMYSAHSNLPWSAGNERDRDPANDPRRSAVIPDPRSGSIDPGSWNQASTPFPATMVLLLL
jgi:hypothetical protein